MQVTIRNGDKSYRATVNQSFIKKHDNGALVSCGLTVGEDIDIKVLNKLIKNGQAKEINQDEANHSGCLSRCKLRGDDICQW